MMMPANNAGQTVMVQAQGGNKLDEMIDQFKQATPVKKASIVVAPFAILAAVYILFTDDDDAADTGARRPSPSASVSVAYGAAPLPTSGLPGQPMGPNAGQPGYPVPLGPATAQGQYPGQPAQPGWPAPGATVPGQVVPGQVVPGQQQPGMVPGQVAAPGYYPGYPQPGQPGQPGAVPTQVLPGQPLPGQPLPGQPYAGQPMPGQPLPGQPLPGQPVPGQPGAVAQPYPNQPVPGQPTATVTAPPAGVPTARSTVTTGVPPTTERRAVDALIQGDQNTALYLYAQLMREHPENPAFATAVRILQARLDAGAAPAPMMVAPPGAPPGVPGRQ
jgi:hypothetical protein